MYIDAFTVLLSGLLVKLVLAGLFLVLWFGNRRAKWFVWWGGTFFLGSLASLLFVARDFGPAFFAAAVALLIAGVACAWQGARAFEKRPPLWIFVGAAPAVWLAACAVPGFMQVVAHRVIVSSVLLASLFAMTAFEFWRGRAEPLPSRWTVVGLFSSMAAIFAIRIPLIGVAPFPFGALPAEPAWVAAFNLLMFFHTVVLAVLLVAMSKERQELRQRTNAQTDSLTGALNRRAFMSRGRRLVLRHQKQREPLSLLFLDLDHFKALNDRYGHSGGDDVLTAFVAVVHDNIRPTDFLFRLGGEEFCCLLPFTRTDEAYQVAQRIRCALEANGVQVAGSPVHVTVSVGIASADAFGYDVDTLVRRADMAVYSAKRRGRNRVVIAAMDDPVDIGREPPIVGDGMIAAE
ncbi:MAG TPA: GGDEF domain-containing protein [Pseudorhodoplanes sp.]|nr:GGDEF domain-containing protein [Pseudorhodoplanes sp.]